MLNLSYETISYYENLMVSRCYVDWYYLGALNHLRFIYGMVARIDCA